MTRLQMVGLDTATGQTKETLAQVKAAYGKVPNVVQVIANSPAALEMYMAMGKAVNKGTFDKVMGERLALTISEANNCDYCLAAHTAAAKMMKLPQAEIENARAGHAGDDARIDAGLQFARAIIERRGFVTDDDLQKVRSAGYNDEELAEIVAHVVKNIMTNYFNHIAETDVDFPAVTPAQHAIA